MINVIADTARMGTDNFASRGSKAVGAGNADQGLGSRKQAWKEEEIGKARDLGICQDRGLAEDGEAEAV